MSQSLSPESIQLIANLINEKNEDLKDHMSDQIRMVKLTVQENHKVALETRDLAKRTNGRVSKLEDEVYGETDTNGKIIPGKEGMVFHLNLVKKWKWFYKNWHFPVGLLAFVLSLQIPSFKKIVDSIIDKIF